jgi:hypothetical protein
MQSPAPQKQKIAGRSDSSEYTKEAFDIIENIKAVTEEDKKQEAEESSDLSDSTITEREIEDKDPPETGGGSIKKAVEALENVAIPSSTSASGVVGTGESSSSSSTSTSSSSSSTAGSDKSGVDISSSDSSDSSRSYSDSESDSSATNKNYNKMPSSITKSPVSNGSRATFEECHSLLEVFGQ